MKDVSRRDVLRLAVGACLAATAGTPSFASVPGDAKTKTIVWGKPAEMTGFDVQVAGMVTDWQMFEMVYETLLTTGQNLKLQPGLAKSWKQLSPTTYIFKLRSEAKFSNGRSLVADDVIGSLQRIKNPKTASYWSTQLGPIAKMEAPDKHTVKVVLAKPYAVFLAALAHITAAILPMKELRAGTFDPTKELLGSGPFMVTDHKQDESWTLTRNPYYWRKGYPLADKLEVPIVSAEAARIAALHDGRVDFTTFSDPEALQMLGRDHRVKVDIQQTTNYYRLDVNALSKASPFHDKRVRQAMNLALDRKLINELVFAGTSKVDYPVPRAFGLQACHNDPAYALPRARRLKMAKALLKEAGNPHPKVTLMATSANPVMPRIAQVIQSSLAEAGFRVKISTPSLTQYLHQEYTKGDFDFSVSWLAGYTDPSMVVAWWDPKFAVWDRIFMKNVPNLDKALTEVKAMPSGSARDNKLADICNMIEDGANMLALVSKVNYFAYRSDKIAVKIAPRAGSADIFQYIYDFKPLH